jgi:hypothetical protein
MAIETPKSRKTVRTIKEEDLQRFYDMQLKIEQAEEKLKKAKKEQEKLEDELVEALKGNAIVDQHSLFIASLEAKKSNFSPKYKELFIENCKTAEKILEKLKASFKPKVTHSLILFKKEAE